MKLNRRGFGNSLNRSADQTRSQVCRWLSRISLGLAGIAFGGMPMQSNLWADDPALVRTIRLEPVVDEISVPVITAMAVSRDSKFLAVAGDDHVIRIIDPETGKSTARLFGHTDWVRTLAFTPDGAALFSAGNDGTVRKWNVDQLWEGSIYLQRPEAILQIAIDANGDFLAVSAFEAPIWLWSLPRNEKVRELSCECGDQRALAFSPDSKNLACGGRDGIVHMWYVDDGALRLEKKFHQGRIHTLAFIPDGTVLLSASQDQRLVWYDLVMDSEELRRELPGCKLMSLVPLDNHCVFVGGTDNQIHLVDWVDEKEISHLSGHIGSVAILKRSGKYLFSGSFDTTIRIWDLEKVVDESEPSESILASPPVFTSTPLERR